MYAGHGSVWRGVNRHKPSLVVTGETADEDVVCVCGGGSIDLAAEQGCGGGGGGVVGDKRLPAGAQMERGREEKVNESLINSFPPLRP